MRIAGLESGNPADVDDRKNPTTIFSVEYMGTNLSPNAQYIQGLELAPDSALPFSHEMVGRFAILSIESDDELDGATVDFLVAAPGGVAGRCLLPVPPLNNKPITTLVHLTLPTLDQV